MADAADLKSADESREGSTPSTRTGEELICWMV